MKPMVFVSKEWVHVYFGSEVAVSEYRLGEDSPFEVILKDFSRLKSTIAMKPRSQVDIANQYLARGRWSWMAEQLGVEDTIEPEEMAILVADTCSAYYRPNPAYSAVYSVTSV